MTGMAQLAENYEVYLDLKTVDPNYTAIDEDVYTLKVIKMGLSKTSTGKPFVAATFAVANHPKFSARRLFHNFWNIQENSSRDAKDLRKLADAVGIQQEGSFERWLESMSQTAPQFKVPVGKRNKTTWNKETQTRELVVNAAGEPEPENVIDFRNTQPA